MREHEELAALIEATADSHNGLWPGPLVSKLYRAAALLREARPQPVPVPVAVSQRLPEPGDCDTEGRCWVGCSAQIDQTGDFDCEYNASWELSPVHPQDEVWLPHWAIPQPPQGGEVEQ